MFPTFASEEEEEEKKTTLQLQRLWLSCRARLKYPEAERGGKQICLRVRAQKRLRSSGETRTETQTGGGLKIAVLQRKESACTHTRAPAVALEE